MLSFRNTLLYRDIIVLFRFLLSDHHTAGIIVQHRLKRQEIQYQLRQSLVAETIIQPELYGNLCLKWNSAVLASISCIKACKAK